MIVRTLLKAGAFTSALALFPLPANAADDTDTRSARILHHHTLPPFGLENIGVTPAELSTALANGLPSGDRPALGSGLQRLGGNYYLGVSDRGPTFTRTSP